MANAQNPGAYEASMTNDTGLDAGLGSGDSGSSTNLGTGSTSGTNGGAGGRSYRGEVPAVGVEPTLPCGNKILSLARLPIPPSGLNHYRCKSRLHREGVANLRQSFF